MSANDHQVGGRHYKTAYEHWDLVLDTGMGYLEGCATKYVARARKKNGVEDLKKALHYVDKLIENWSEVPHNRVGFFAPCFRFAETNQLLVTEQTVIALLVGWAKVTDLELARDMIQKMIAPSGITTEPKPVPLTEENHHSERVTPISER